MPPTSAKHIETLNENISEVRRLLRIHQRIAGSKPGYKHGVEVLNKSSIVLLVACWEAFVEDLAESAFDFMLSKSSSYEVFPMNVLTRASKVLKGSQDEREIWKLAQDGWKTVLSDYKRDLIEHYLGKFNTPKPEKIDALYESLIGVTQISQYWYWKSMSADSSRRKLTLLVELRGSIAHRVATSKSVRKSDVRDYLGFVHRLAVISSNRVSDFISERVKEQPWHRYSFGKTS